MDKFIILITVLVLSNLFLGVLLINTIHYKDLYKSNMTYYKSQYEEYKLKFNYVVNEFGITNVSDYFYKLNNYTKYIENKDTIPCNCTNYTDVSGFILQLDDKTFSLHRTIICNDTRYKEVISFNYLVPMLKNYSIYHPTQFCIEVGSK